MLAGKPVIPARLRYPLHCKDCNASINGKADWDKSCCNSCANYEPPTNSSKQSIEVTKQ